MKNYSSAIRPVNIIEELEKRGIKGRKTSTNFYMCCPYHGEKNPSFGIRIVEDEKKGSFGCFSCHKRGNFFDLISHLDGIPFFDVVAKYTREDVEVEKIPSMRMKLKEKLRDGNKKHKIKTLDSAILDRFIQPRGEFLKYLHGRGIGKAVIKEFNLLACSRGKWENRIVIPVYDLNYNLISLTARSILSDITSGMKVRKVRDTDVKSILFGLDKIEEGSFVVLVEGEFDAMYLQQFGIPAIAVGSSDISKDQLIALINFQPSKVFICLDGDDAGRDGSIVLKEKIEGYFDVSRIMLEESKDPNNLTKSEVKKIFAKTLGGVLWLNKKNLKKS